MTTTVTPGSTRGRGIDPGIEPYVQALMDHGVETFESCQGGDGHAFHVPTIRFYGKQYEGFRALGVALAIGLPVMNLRRYWDISGGEPCGPSWEMEFRTVPDLGQPEWWKPAGDDAREAQA